MAKTVRVTEKMSEQLTVLVGKTYSDAIKYLLDHHVVFPPKLISHIDELIKNSQLGYRSKEEFLYEAARRLLKLINENIESINVPRNMYEKTKTAIEDLDLPFMGVDDFVEEQLKKLNEQHDQWKEQKETEKSETHEF